MIEITIYTLSDEIPNLPKNVNKWTKLINAIQLNNNSNIQKLLNIGIQISNNHIINGLYWNVLRANIDEIDPFDMNVLKRICSENNDLMINKLRIYRRCEHEAKIKYYENKYILFSRPVNNDFEFFIPVMDKSIFKNYTNDFITNYNNLTSNGVVYKHYKDLKLYYIRILYINSDVINFINNIINYYHETNADLNIYDRELLNLTIYDMKIYIATREFLKELI